MALENFEFTANPVLFFGEGKINMLTDLLKQKGSSFVFIVGNHFIESEKWAKLSDAMNKEGMQFQLTSFKGEPTVDYINNTVALYKSFKTDCIVSIGGGSIIDAGKALSAMLTVENPVEDYLEGVGKLIHPGTKIPMIAIPTTAGTGSEATKNAVICRHGVNGFKKSLRHNNFVPDIALIDPELIVSCSPEITAASGLDAFTQLLESYVSSKANTYTEALAMSGIKSVKDFLICSYSNGNNVNARSAMAYAAYLSGLTLSNAGLGTVHGFASAIGGMFDIPHGIICGSLLAPCTKMNIQKLLQTNNFSALEKYAKVGCVINNQFYQKMNESHIKGREMLIKKLYEWTEKLQIPSLSSNTDNKNNPVQLTKEDLAVVLRERLG